jgi:hypothetical protein
MSQNKTLSPGKRKLLTRLVAFVPVKILFVAGILQGWSSYNGFCGLLDAGWSCGRIESALLTIFNPLVLPVLLLESILWVIAVYLASFIIGKAFTGNGAAT